MDLGLVGRANAGKTALFCLVTGAHAEIAPYPYTTREPARAMADLFPAYDDDGGLLLVLTPEK